MAATAAATRPSGSVLAIPNYGSASPNRIKLAAGARAPVKSVSVSSPAPAPSAAVRSRRSCMCSPTNHPGSFRCSLHKERKAAPGASPPPACRSAHGHGKPASAPPSPPPSSTAVSTGYGAGGAFTSAMVARRALAPSQQSQNRRRFAAAAAGVAFRPRPSRLSAVSLAGDNRQ